MEIVKKIDYYLSILYNHNASNTFERTYTHTFALKQDNTHAHTLLSSKTHAHTRCRVAPAPATPSRWLPSWRQQLLHLRSRSTTTTQVGGAAGTTTLRQTSRSRRRSTAQPAGTPSAGSPRGSSRWSSAGATRRTP